MADQKIFSFATARQMARFLLEDDRVWYPDFVEEVLRTESTGTPTVSGSMEFQVLCKDIHGNEISFPIEIIIRTTFDPAQNAALDDGEIKRHGIMEEIRQRRIMREMEI